MTDQELESCIQLSANGNSRAFEPIVRMFERPLRAWLATVSPPGVDVDEIAQRAFITIYGKLPEFKKGTNFSAWLYTVARYQLRTETTRLRRIADYHTRYAPDLLLQELERREAVSPELITEKLEYLKSCLSKLEDHVKRFVVWRYEEEIPLEEMAKRSGRSVTAVKKQLWKLRQKLQDCIMSYMEGGKGTI
jgi:RNA polymerase sigma-70 factor (ECF subfamily)